MIPPRNGVLRVSRSFRQIWSLGFIWCLVFGIWSFFPACVYQPARPLTTSDTPFQSLVNYMTAKYSFRLQSQDKRRALPGKIILSQDTTETVTHVMLKLLAYVLFYRDRIQIEGNLHNDAIPFTPDLVQ